MRLRSWVAPCVCALAFARRSENADPAQTNAELGRVTTPADVNETMEGRAHNRRIEIVLVPCAAATRLPEAAGSGDAAVAPPSPTDAATPLSDDAP